MRSSSFTSGARSPIYRLCRRAGRCRWATWASTIISGGTATNAHFDLQAGQDGAVHGLSISTLGMAPGQWAITYHGKGSSHEAIGYFYLTSTTPAATPTRPPTVPGTPTRP